MHLVSIGWPLATSRPVTILANRAEAGFASEDPVEKGYRSGRHRPTHASAKLLPLERHRLEDASDRVEARTRQMGCSLVREATGNCHRSSSGREGLSDAPRSLQVQIAPKRRTVSEALEGVR
jgi:hypothetical protein